MGVAMKFDLSEVWPALLRVLARFPLALLAGCVCAATTIAMERLGNDDDPWLMRIFLRITSYNVCYTKLLRG